MTWLDEAKQLSLSGVAAEIGLTIRGKTMTCPLGCQSRARGDRRLPVTFEGKSWKCWSCGASGDTIDIVSYAVSGSRFSGRDNKVREWFIDGGKIRIDIKEIPEVVLQYAPISEVQYMWATGRPLQPGSECYRWVVSRLGEEATDRVRYIVKELHQKYRPRWAWGYGGTWHDAGYRALFPMFDAYGTIRGIRARQIDSSKDRPKSQGPARCKAGGLVLACPLALTMLHRGTMPQHGLVICEGEPAFLGWASRRRDAVIGIGSGWWTQEIAARVPRRTRVLVATDTDGPGKRYGDQIESSLSHCSVVRGSPMKDADEIVKHEGIGALSALWGSR